VVEGDGFACQLGRPPAGHRGDHRADRHPFCRECDDRHQQPRVVGRERSPEDVVPEEEAIPAGCLGLPGQITQRPGLGDGAEVGHEDAVAQASDRCQIALEPEEGAEPLRCGDQADECEELDQLLLAELGAQHLEGGVIEVDAFRV
jgi:hypothetical protein